MNVWKVISFIGILLISLSLSADPISDVNTAYPFENLFTHELYRLDVANDYDTKPFDQKNLKLFKKLFGETFDQMLINAQGNVELIIDETLLKLEKRKINKLIKDKVIPILTYLNELSTISWKDLGIKTVRTVGTTTTTTGGAAYIFGKTDNQGVKTFNYKVAAGVLVANVVFEAGLAYYAEDGSRQKRIEAKALIAILLNKIKNENIKDLEALYIENQSIYNDDWQNAIENKLIASRKAPRGMGNNDSLGELQDLLNFSTKTISLPPNYQEGDEFVEKTNDFIAELFEEGNAQGNQQKLSFYKEAVREELEQIIRDICQCSQNAIAGEEGDTFKAYLFFGKPGAGKSVAAKLIAKALGLPIYHLDIINESDFKPSSLYGSGSFVSSNKGHFPKAFLTQNAKGERSKNIVIIMDDIDRAFTKDAVTGKILDAKGLMKALLKMLGNDTLFFDADYYGIKKFDKSQVHFICTTNTDFTVALNKEEFEALDSRVKLIRFTAADKEAKKKHIRGYLTDRKLSMSKVFYQTKDQWPRVRNAIADFIVDHYDADDNREVSKRIDALLQKMQDKWEETATTKKWPKTDDVVAQ